MQQHGAATYERLRRALTGRRLPLAFVDLDAFDANIAAVARTQRRSGKTVRIASKSIRCVDLIRRVLETGGDGYRGILAFTAEEAAHLAERGFTDIVVAYPSVQAADMEALVRATRLGAAAVAMVDCRAHLEALSAAGRSAGVTLEACLEIDMSWRPLGRRLHLGVRRSPVRTADQALALAACAAELANVRLTAVMGYEAQIASVSDRLPGRPLMNAALRAVKRLSVAELTRRRTAVVDRLKAAGHRIRIVNGGGSGSLASTARDASVTEVTAGSAFYAPALFHHFREVAFTPAAFFALQVVRHPAPGIVTCMGGGYAASGAVGVDKRPLPVLPPGLRFIDMEGAGEVQTPLRLPAGAAAPAVGQPVFFQHAKAGELCERFNALCLVRGDRIVGEAATYRGDGFSFL